MIHIYCGDGKGKTTAAAGLAVRMAGHRKRVLFIQFLKGSRTGETDILGREENITVMRCDKNYGFFSEMSKADRESITKCHNENLAYALANADSFDMIVLDELFAALEFGLADSEAARGLVMTYKGELVLTGREPDSWYKERADYISEIKKIKHPYDKGVDAREGIEY